MIRICATAIALLAAIPAMAVTIDLSDAKPRPLTASERGVIARAVAAALKDPDAAKFQWGPIILARDSAAYCGLVNGKNAYGGYVGFRPFMVRVTFSPARAVVDAKLIAVSTGPNDTGSDPYAGACANFGYTGFPGS